MIETDDLIGRIYESIGHPGALGDALTQIGLHTRSRGTQLGVVDKAGRWAIGQVVGIHPAMLPTYLEHYVADDPRMAFSRRNPGRLVACHQVVGDQTAFERSAIVNDLLDKAEARFAMASMIPAGPDHFAILCVMRARRDGRYEDEEIGRLARLIPHIRTAISLHIRLGRLESSLLSIEGLLDRLRSPAVLVDQAGGLRHANTAGQEAFRREDYLVLRNGRVESSSPRQSRQFADLLAGALAEKQSSESAPYHASMRLFDAHSGFAVLTVYCIRGQPGFTETPPPRAILFLTYSDGEASMDAAALQILFGLTAAETRLATHLIRGLGLPEICRRLHLSRETVKSELAALFDKTGTHRQGELVARLHASVSSLLM